MTTVAITGAAGRMGRRLIALLGTTPQLKLLAAIERPDSPHQGEDCGELAGAGRNGVPVTFDLRPTPDVLIDFSAPSATRHWLKVCRDRGIAMVIGTTGLHQVDHAAIDVAAEAIPVLQAGNMSLGVNLLLKLVGEIARRLGDDYDIEIAEAHHRHKKDAPSGTAHALLSAILNATGKTADAVVYGRHGDDALRIPGSIGVHSLRMGDEVGRHTVYFGGPGERIEVTHVATDRDVFARGALRAAAWLAGKPPGRYTVADVLGL
ncbi:MAG: 4-hydroxy-tetrahydrodipicolinate reductase [Tepidisphaerales bacterium]